MFSRFFVKQEPLEETETETETLARPALTPVSIKSESSSAVQAVQAESSSSRRRSARHVPLPPSPEADTEEDEEPINEDGVYVVGGIVAKSLDRWMGPWGHEYQYLVRWAGYGPQDDTWEYTSNVIQGAKEMLDKFDKKEHPFNIVDSSAHRGGRRYLVESCAKRESGSGLWSPLAEREWMTATHLRVRRRVGDASVQRETKDSKNRSLPTPPSSIRGVKREHTSDDEGEDIDQGEDLRNIAIDGKRYTERVLLEIVGHRRYKEYKRPYKTRYRVIHYLRDRTRGYQTKEEWYTNGYLLHLFGPKVILEKLQAYMPEPEVKAEITSADGVVDTGVTDYEKDRLRRMQENADLMKELGLAL